MTNELDAICRAWFRIPPCRDGRRLSDRCLLGLARSASPDGVRAAAERRRTLAAQVGGGPEAPFVREVLRRIDTAERRLLRTPPRPSPAPRTQPEAVRLRTVRTTRVVTEPPTMSRSELPPVVSRPKPKPRRRRDWRPSRRPSDGPRLPVVRLALFAVVAAFVFDARDRVWSAIATADGRGRSAELAAPRPMSVDVARRPPLGVDTARTPVLDSAPATATGQRRPEAVAGRTSSRVPTPAARSRFEGPQQHDLTLSVRGPAARPGDGGGRGSAALRRTAAAF